MNPSTTTSRSTGRTQAWRATAAALLTTALLLPEMPAHAAEATMGGGVHHTVLMGAVDPDLPDPTPRPPAGSTRLDRFEYLAYYPDQLRVHRGDTVLFRRDGFHTVTFSPDGADRRGFIRRDEIRGVAAEDSSEPSDPTCGTPTTPCTLSSTDQFANSGWQDLSLTVDLPEGSYTYYCMLHEGMEGTVEVVPDEEALPTDEQIETERQEQVAEDTAQGAALIAAGQTPDFEVTGDHRRWFVKVGDYTADDRVAVLRFLPSNLKIAPDDEVQFVVPGEPAPPPGRSEVAAELHTVTFPDDAVAQSTGILRYFNPACDPDDVASGLPGVPGMFPAFVTGCPLDSTLELIWQPWAWTAPMRAPGDVVATPVTVHDSGLITRDGVSCRSTCDPWTAEPFPTSSRAVFPTDGAFSYVCLIHPQWAMAGSVVVDGS